jgi:hypothetical protein
MLTAPSCAPIMVRGTIIAACLYQYNTCDAHSPPMPVLCWCAASSSTPGWSFRVLLSTHDDLARLYLCTWLWPVWIALEAGTAR